VSGLRHAPAAFYPRETSPGKQWIWGWVGLRAGLNIEARRKTLCFCPWWNPGHPVCSQTLYCLSYSFRRTFSNDRQLSGRKCGSLVSRYLKLKLFHYMPRRRLGERRYSSYSFSNSALDGGYWSASRPDRALSPGEGPPVRIVQKAGCASEPIWTYEARGQILSLLPGSNFDHPVIQPVASQYTE
jgi:hypothetical protein